MKPLINSQRWSPSRHILFPTDLTPRDLFPFSVACDLARGMNARLTVLHAMPVGDLRPRSARRSQIETRLERLQSALSDHCIDTALVGGDPASQIITWSQEMQPDLIIMRASRDRGLVGRIVDTVSQRVLRLAACPVISVNPADADGRHNRLFGSRQYWKSPEPAAIGVESEISD
jgi:nucleotide-binding universal stress UspA family protein